MRRGIAFSLDLLLLSLNRLGAVLEGPFERVVWPQAAIWWILPTFAGIALAWETTLGVWSFFGDRKEAALYAYWTMATARFDAARVLRLIASIIGIPGLVLTLLATPEHDLLRQKDILARGYGFSAARLYRYSATIYGRFRHQPTPKRLAHSSETW